VAMVAPLRLRAQEGERLSEGKGQESQNVVDGEIRIRRLQPAKGVNP